MGVQEKSQGSVHAMSGEKVRYRQEGQSEEAIGEGRR
jgi:hypothetical protein